MNSYHGYLRAGVFASAIAAVAAFSLPASAVTYSDCTSNIDETSGLVDNATDCEISSATQDNVNDPLVVNEDGGFFGMDTWLFGAKLEDGAHTGQSGTYDFSGSTGSGAGTIKMIVFKDGQDTSLIGYMVSAVTGDWESPFRDPPFDFNPDSKIKDVSHISFYYKQGDEVVIPLPASLPLLLGGLAGLAFITRRRKAA